VVEEDGADIVEMPSEGEETLALLVVPHLDLVVVTTGTEDGLRRVKADTTNRACCQLP
jgi:hypothetical protein